MQAVVCPGSRNSPLVHNLCECKEIKCYPVTDERSAAFFALGVAMSTHSPVVVCVYVGVGTAERRTCRGRSVLPEPTFDSCFSRPPPAMDRAIGRTNYATSQRSRSVCAQERPPYRTQNEGRTLVLQPFGKRSSHRMQAICVMPQCISTYQ